MRCPPRLLAQPSRLRLPRRRAHRLLLHRQGGEGLRHAGGVAQRTQRALRHLLEMHRQQLKAGCRGGQAQLASHLWQESQAVRTARHEGRAERRQRQRSRTAGHNCQRSSGCASSGAARVLLRGPAPPPPQRKQVQQGSAWAGWRQGVGIGEGLYCSTLQRRTTWPYKLGTLARLHRSLPP